MIVKTRQCYSLSTVVLLSVLLWSHSIQNPIKLAKRFYKWHLRKSFRPFMDINTKRLTLSWPWRFSQSEYTMWYFHHKPTHINHLIISALRATDRRCLYFFILCQSIFLPFSKLQIVSVWGTGGRKSFTKIFTLGVLCPYTNAGLPWSEVIP